MGQVEAANRLRGSVALGTALLLMLMAQSELLGQQMAYAPGPPSGYGQRYTYPVYTQPNYQPGYASQPYNSYPQPSYGYGYPSQTYRPTQAYPPAYQQQYSSPSQSYAQQGYGTAQAGAQGLNAQQLEQLAAPIAIYPDTLVALVLAAATYPGQVVEADRWRRAQGNAGPDQIAAGADMQSWDPSVKGLTAFPQVLAEMDRNLGWTTALGSAYYNQPQDTLQAVQVLRQRAEAAGNLRSTPQQSVSYSQGNVVVQPADQQMVYVPSYDPWNAYGQSINPYPGFSLLGALGSLFDSSNGSSAIQFGLGIAMNAFSHMSWGWLGWGLNWLAQSIFFHQSSYVSQSTSVADWGLPHGGPRAYLGGGAGHGFNANGFYSNGYGRVGGGVVRTGAPIVRMPAYGGNRPGQGYDRGYEGSRTRGGYSQPLQLAYHHEPQIPGRPQQAYGGSSFYGRQGAGYGGSVQGFRSPAESYGRSNSSRWGPNSFTGKSNMKAWKAPSQSGGFHFFGGGHAPKAPKGFGGHSSGGGGHSGGGHGGGGGHGSRHH
jgi:Protein of unknown function (DUF3300)